MGILENIQILQTLIWLDEQINKTNMAIGMGPTNVVFDRRHYIYRHLKNQLLEDHPEARKVFEIVSGVRTKELNEYLKDHNLIPEDEDE